jgi:LuxR family transcriptional regulator, maltose regulon positive regulatory protein
MAAALDKAGVEIGANSRALLEASQPVASKFIVTNLLNDLNRTVSPYLLVIDDYHFITDSTIHKTIAFLLDHIPANLQIIVASRSDPPLPLARWRTRGQIYEIRASDLQFTLPETVSFLTQAMGSTLAEKDMAALNARTEGWIAGLQLATLSMRGRADIADYVKAFAGSNRLVFHYLVDEVLNRQPKDIQQFLVQLSVLERFCGPLCDALTGRTDSQALLERLYASELFIVPLDEEGYWYRYHHLFRDFLRHALLRTDPAQIPHLHRFAANWFESQQLLAEAIPHVLAIPDYNLAARLITPIGMPMIQRGEHGILRRWLDTIPELILATPHTQICAICPPGSICLPDKSSVTHYRWLPKQPGVQRAIVKS